MKPRLLFPAALVFLATLPVISEQPAQHPRRRTRLARIRGTYLRRPLPGHSLKPSRSRSIIKVGA
jgi:hypothetical protein